MSYLSIFDFPNAYVFFQRAVGAHRLWKRYISEFIKPGVQCRILDIGSGTSDILAFLPETTIYAGYDLDEGYIRFAKKRFGNRGQFIPERVNKMDIKNHQPYDVVMANGLIHHLNDEEAKTLFEIGFSALKKNGIMVTETVSGK